MFSTLCVSGNVLGNRPLIDSSPLQIGIVLILTESGGGWIFLFIFPLAFTLTTFMMWTLHSLNATIEYLTQRKQSEWVGGWPAL